MADQIIVPAHQIQPGKDRLVGTAQSRFYGQPQVAARTNRADGYTVVEWYSSDGIRQWRIWRSHTLVTVLRDTPDRTAERPPDTAELRRAALRTWLVAIAVSVASAVAAVLAVWKLADAQWLDTLVWRAWRAS